MAAKTQTDDPVVVGFQAEVSSIDDALLILLPSDASRQLPSRGQVAVTATIGGHQVETVVEPDGRRGHWLRVGDALRKAARLGPGDETDVTLQVEGDWPEPEVPDDLATALSDAPADIREIWEDITPMARWEWVRWVQATRNPDTRQRRVEVSLSKMENGKRRPCCFDLSSCTDAELARSGKLRETSE